MKEKHEIRDTDLLSIKIEANAFNNWAVYYLFILEYIKFNP